MRRAASKQSERPASADAPAAAPPPPPRDDGSSAPTAVHELLRWLSATVPPLTIITALLFWFGWTFTNTRAGYFGLDYTTLGFTTTDYVMRSADGIFVPATVTLVIVLVGLALHGGVVALRRNPRASGVVRVAAIVALVLGVVASALGVRALFVTLPFDASYLLPPALLGIGVIVTVYATRVLRHAGARRNTRPELWERYAGWAAGLLALLMLFWAFSLYAAALGTGRAMQLQTALDGQPSVTVYSAQDLSLGPPVVTTRIESPDAAYRYRYTGLKLVLKSGGKFFMLTSGWDQQTGLAVVLDEGPTVRFEFSPGGVSP
jgi:hypothetical protein